MKKSYQKPVARNQRAVLFISLFLVTGYWFLVSSPFSYASSKTSDILAAIPVQHEGRVKPFESFARESVLAVTGKETYDGRSATEVVWRWIAEPSVSSGRPMIPVAYKPFQREFSLSLIGGRASPEIVLNLPAFMDKAQAAFDRQSKKEMLSMEEKKRLEIYHHAFVFREIASGSVPGFIPNPEDPRIAWMPSQGMAAEEGEKALAQYFPVEKVTAAARSYSGLIQELRKNFDSEASQRAAESFRTHLSGLLDSRGISLDQKVLTTERMYNRLHPFAWAWKFYLASVLLGLAMLLFTKDFARASFIPGIRRLDFTPLLFFFAGFAIHFYGFYLRCVVAGRPPVTNMYESIIWVSWAVVLFSVILFAVYRARLIPMTSAAVATLALLIAESFPVVLAPTIAPLVPVLRSNLWLSVHVLTITLSYGAFALAWGLGHGVVFSFAFQPEKEETHRALSQYLYRALQIGVILLAAGTVLGGVWANYSWGRFWGWDPKETWALIALLGYLAVLHGRFAGWLSVFGTAVGSVVAFLGVLMAWYGVNFVLAQGLHSYGFGGGGLPYVAAAVLADLAVLGGAVVVYRSRKHEVGNFSSPKII